MLPQSGMPQHHRSAASVSHTDAKRCLVRWYHVPRGRDKVSVFDNLGISIWCWCHGCDMQPRDKAISETVETNSLYLMRLCASVLFPRQLTLRHYGPKQLFVFIPFGYISLHYMTRLIPPNHVNTTAFDLSDESKHKLIKKVTSFYDLFPIIACRLFI